MSTTAATTATTGNTTTTTSTATTGNTTTTTITSITTTATTRTTTTTTTTTTTEILSNPNLSCRLLECLNSLPFHDQRVFRSLLGHIELVRLSACCHSLRSSIRNDQLLWQALYHRDFLSGAHYDKEMEFVLWCIRTDVNNPCTSDKRVDLLENVDWYNTYRRRVSTENNWRYGRCKTTRIDMEYDKDGIYYRRYVSANRVFITQQGRPDRVSGHSYTVEHLPHSNLRSTNSIEYNSTLSTSSNIISLDTGNETKYFYVTGDHYIAVYPKEIRNSTNHNVKILSCKHGGVITTFDVPARYKVEIIEGKWILLVNRLQELINDLRIWKINVMVFDIDNSIMCPGSIDGTWEISCFYKTTNDTAIVYTARLVKDDVDRIEWALYQFSSNNPAIQLRNGWFHLPERTASAGLVAYNSYNSHMIIELYGDPDYISCIMHSVASSGQSHIPRNCYTMTDQHIPIPLLRAGYKYSIYGSRPTKVWTDLSYNDDQVLQIPGTTFIEHIIGDLYIFITDHNQTYNRLLVDINTKEIIRKLEAPNISGHLKIDAMFGTICNPSDSDELVIEEYGEL